MTDDERLAQRLVYFAHLVYQCNRARDRGNNISPYLFNKKLRETTERVNDMLNMLIKLFQKAVDVTGYDGAGLVAEQKRLYFSKFKRSKRYIPSAILGFLTRTKAGCKHLFPGGEEYEEDIGDDVKSDVGESSGGKEVMTRRGRESSHR